MDEQAAPSDASGREEATPSWWGEGSAASPSSGEGDESTSSSAHTRISDATHQSEEAFAPPAYWVTPEPSSTRRSASQLSPYAGATRRVGHPPRRSNRTRHILLGANAAVVLVIVGLCVLIFAGRKQIITVVAAAPSPVHTVSSSAVPLPTGNYPQTCVDDKNKGKMRAFHRDDVRVLKGPMSCPFIDVVRDNTVLYVSQHPTASVFTEDHLFSPVTGKTYQASCDRTDDDVVTCMGVDDSGIHWSERMRISSSS